MTKQEEHNKRVLNTARKLKQTVSTEGWENIVGYVLVRTNGLKNKLAKINLTEKLSEAMRTQGEIEGIESVINRVNNVIQEAKLIEEKEKK